METNLFVYIINHNTITGYKTKTTSVLLVCKIHHKLSVVSSLNSACLTIKACLNPPELLFTIDKLMSGSSLEGNAS